MIFLNEKTEPVIIEKDGTKFFFNYNDGVKKQAVINAAARRDESVGGEMLDRFRLSLAGWENLKDGSDNDIRFSVPIRDALVTETETFNIMDILDIVGEKPDTEGEKSQKKPSTSKKPSRKR